LGEGCHAICPGSVGQPRDGDPRAAFAVLDVEQHTITFHRVMYDVTATIEKMGEYPQSLADMLLTANGRVNLALYRGVYQVPDLTHLKVQRPRRSSRG
jgi:diadenosine tetraphosphatase ApaH/serine/threonine PP2A family protein phosphatase